MRRLLPSLALLLAAQAAIAADEPVVTRATLRVITPQVPAAGYFELANPGDKPLVLTGARSATCGMLMMHRSENTGGMSHMSDVASVTVAPRERVAFAPGGYHLMCMSPKPGLRAGAKVTVTLTFAG